MDNWLEYIRKKLDGWERHSGFCENGITLVRITEVWLQISVSANNTAPTWDITERSWGLLTMCKA